MIISKRAKYLEKKEEESGNITYIYSEKDIKQRNKKKAKRLEKLNNNIKKLRGQVAKDLKSEEPTLKDIATVVALIDETFERIGNPESAGNDHHGVTTWKVKHVTFSKGKAKLKYVGKSGVKQEKDVTTSAVVKALKEKVKDKKKNEEIFPDINGKLVNLYLKEYKITAKDIRGFHANEEMRKALKENRKGSLPKDQKEKEKKLKEEFKKALETAAENVGHEPSTLKNQYLIPSIQETYLASGKIAKASNEIKLSKRAEELEFGTDLRDLFPKEKFIGEWKFETYEPFAIYAKSEAIGLRYALFHVETKLVSFSDPNLKSPFVYNISIVPMGRLEGGDPRYDHLLPAGSGELRMRDVSFEKLKELAPKIVELANELSTQGIKAKASNEIKLSKRADQFVEIANKLSLKGTKAQAADVIEFPKDKVQPAIKKDLPAEISPIKPHIQETPIVKGINILNSLIKKVQEKQISEEDFVMDAGYVIVKMQESLFDEDI